jgi:hypothetical protein
MQAIFIASDIFFPILSLHASEIRPITMYPAWRSYHLWLLMQF